MTYNIRKMDKLFMKFICLEMEKPDEDKLISPHISSAIF